MISKRKDTNNQIMGFFDLLFSRSKSEKYTKSSLMGKREEERTDNLEGAFNDMLINPGLYPLEMGFGWFFDDLQRFSSKELEPIVNPNRYSQRVQDDNMMLRSWARLGGFISRSTDSALATLLCYRCGMYAIQALQIGKMLSLSQETYLSELMGKKDAKEYLDNFDYTYKQRIEELRKNSIEVLSLSLESRNPSVKAKDIHKILNSDSPSGALLSLGLSPEDVNYASSMLGNLSGREGKVIEESGRRIAIDLVAGYVAKTSNPKSREKTVKMLETILDEKPRTLGVQAIHAMKTYKWLKDSIGGDFTSSFIKGDFERIGIMENREYPLATEGSFHVNDSGNVQSLGLMMPKDNFIGRTLAPLYYLHPKNLVRGLLVDGKYWLYLCKKDGVLDTKKFPYLMYSLTSKLSPFNFGKNMMGLVSNTTSRLVTHLNNLFGVNKIKGLLLKSLTKLLPKFIPGVGMVISLIMDFVGDAFTKAIYQLVAIIFWAAAGLIVLLFALLEPSMYGITDGSLDTQLKTADSRDLDFSGYSDSSFDADAFDIMNPKIDTSGLNWMGYSDNGFDPNNFNPMDPSNINKDALSGVSEYSDQNGKTDLDYLFNFDESYEDSLNGMSGYLQPGSYSDFDWENSDITQLTPIDTSQIVNSEQSKESQEEYWAELQRILNLPTNLSLGNRTNPISKFTIASNTVYEAYLTTTQDFDTEVSFWKSYLSSHYYTIENSAKIEEEDRFVFPARLGNRSLTIAIQQQDSEVTVGISYDISN